MNVLVTGVDGFVGSHLAEALLPTHNLRLFGLVKRQPPSSNIDHIREKINFVEADITDAEQIESAIASCKPRKIFHIAGQAFVPKSMENPRETIESNIVGTLNILEAVRQLGATHQLHCSTLLISSGEIYGPASDASLPLDENTPLNPMNPYAASKACVDLIGQQYRSSFNLDVMIARPFNHLGPRQSELFVGSAFAKQIAEIKTGRREPKLFVGNLDPERDFTDVRDVVQAYIKLLEGRRRHGVYNVCSGKAVAIRQLLESLRELSGVKLEITPDPKRQRPNDLQRVVGSSERLRTETGWMPKIPWEKTLRDLLAYWEEYVRRAA